MQAVWYDGLLDERDPLFIESAPGGNRRLADEVRRNRRRIYFTVLRELRREAAQIRILRMGFGTAPLREIVAFELRLKWDLGMLYMAGVVHRFSPRTGWKMAQHRLPGLRAYLAQPVYA